MRVIVCGSRGWHDRKAVSDALYDLWAEKPEAEDVVIVHGAAKGADRIAEQEAQKLGYLVESHPADWENLGKRAGLARNTRMAELGADLCIAFWDGRSTGTAHMIKEAELNEIPVRIVLKP